MTFRRSAGDPSGITACFLGGVPGAGSASWKWRCLGEVLSQLEEFSCGNATGNVDVSDITAQEVNITSAAGDLSLLSLQGEKVHLSTVSGEVQWTQGWKISLLKPPLAG